jgi:DNA recombination-dependent growth factor C
MIIFENSLSTFFHKSVSNTGTEIDDIVDAKVLLLPKGWSVSILLVVVFTLRKECLVVEKASVWNATNVIAEGRKTIKKHNEFEAFMLVSL